MLLGGIGLTFELQRMSECEISILSKKSYTLGESWVVDADQMDTVDARKRDRGDSGTIDHLSTRYRS